MPGKIVTYVDGYKKKSKHQLYLAADLLILRFEGNAFREKWNLKEIYTILGEFWEKLGGYWGGNWKDIKDYYHFEV